MVKSLVERVLERAEDNPSKVCLVQGEDRITFGDLAGQIRDAGALMKGADDEGTVAVLIDNSAEYVAAMYGAWLSGRGVLSLNTGLKAGEIARLMEHAGATLLAVDPGHPEVASLRTRLQDRIPVLEIRPGGGFPRAPRPVEIPSPDPESLASLVYTSGTTGHPKGVMLSHRNLAANMSSISRALPIRQDDRALCVLPFQYSYGASVLHTHLAAGATLVLERSFMYPHQVLARVATEGVTSFAGVPSTFYLLLNRTDLSSFELSSLRYVTQAGGPMDPEKIREFRTLVPGTDFIVMYGQTEATARLAVLPPQDLDRKQGSAGQAIPGVDLQVRSEDGAVLPRGQRGEVCARGQNVMMGYWRDPEETEKVLKNGWLWTGDIGRLDEEGFLFLEGRSREMIKSGAHRIAPGEIEEVIRGVAGVLDVAVGRVDDPVLGEAVKAWVISSDTRAELKREILRTCHERLARFKIPKEVEFRTEFPRTASGKVRKHLL